MKFPVPIFLLAIGMCVACSKSNVPPDSSDEFEVFRCDGERNSSSIILFTNGSGILSIRTFGLLDYPCKWSEQDDVITLSGWGNLDDLAVELGQVPYGRDPEDMVLHRRNKEGSEVLVSAAKIEEFDAGEFSKSWIFWRAGPDAVVGYKSFWLENEPGVRYVGKRFDQ